MINTVDNYIIITVSCKTHSEVNPSSVLLQRLNFNKFQADILHVIEAAKLILGTLIIT